MSDKEESPVVITRAGIAIILGGLTVLSTAGSWIATGVKMDAQVQALRQDVSQARLEREKLKADQEALAASIVTIRLDLAQRLTKLEDDSGEIRRGLAHIDGLIGAPAVVQAKGRAR